MQTQTYKNLHTENNAQFDLTKTIYIKTWTLRHLKATVHFSSETKLRLFH